MTDDRRDNIIQRRKMADNVNGCFHMPFDDLIFFICQTSRFIQYIFRNSDFSNVMKQSCLADDLNHILIHAKCCCQSGRIIEHVIRMTERIMIFRIDGCSQCINRRFIFPVNMCTVFGIPLLVRIAEHRIKHLDSVLSAMLHMVNSKIHILHQFLDSSGCIWCCTDSGTDCHRLQLHIRPSVIHHKNLLCDRLYQISGWKQIIFWKQDCKFFSSVAGYISTVTHTASNDRGNVLQADISFLDSVQLII